MLQVTEQIRIPETELREHFIHGSGPGGQNVNKVATAVQLHFNVVESTSLPPPVRERLLRIAAGRINRHGELMIEAHRYRTQERNRADARARLARWIARAATPPKTRKPTRPTRAAREKRLRTKKRRGQHKAMRRTPEPE